VELTPIVVGDGDDGYDGSGDDGMGSDDMGDDGYSGDYTTTV
jgi:hypothetical protein